MVQSDYGTVSQVVGVFKAKIKALPVKLNLDEHFLDGYMLRFNFLTVH